MAISPSEGRDGNRAKPILFLAFLDLSERAHAASSASITHEIFDNAVH
jgi:hypothetical protein